MIVIDFFSATFIIALFSPHFFYIREREWKFDRFLLILHSYFQMSSKLFNQKDNLSANSLVDYCNFKQDQLDYLQYGCCWTADHGVLT